MKRERQDALLSEFLSERDGEEDVAGFGMTVCCAGLVCAWLLLTKDGLVEMIKEYVFDLPPSCSRHI